MISVIRDVYKKLDWAELGVVIQPAQDESWHLIRMEAFAKARERSEGFVQFLLHDKAGRPVGGVDVLLCWGQGLTTTQTNRHGRARLCLWDAFDTDRRQGPCWASVVDSSTEVHGLGILPGHWIVYKLIYMRANNA